MEVVIVLAVVLGLAAAGLVAALVAARRSLVAATARAEGAEATVVEVRSAADEERVRLVAGVDAAAARAEALASDLATAAARADDLTGELAAVTTERDSAAAAAATERAAAEAERVRAVAADEALAAGRAAGHDGATLWTLEVARAERTWRHSVAPSPDQPSPLTGSPGDLPAMLEIDAAAAREEVGARIDVEWSIPTPDDPETALLVRRVVEEMIAVAAHHSETATVRLGADGADIVVAVDPIGDDGSPVAAALGAAGRVVADGPGRLRVRGRA